MLVQPFTGGQSKQCNSLLQPKERKHFDSLQNFLSFKLEEQKNTLLCFMTTDGARGHVPHSSRSKEMCVLEILDHSWEMSSS